MFLCLLFYEGKRFVRLRGARIGYENVICVVRLNIFVVFMFAIRNGAIFVNFAKIQIN